MSKNKKLNLINLGCRLNIYEGEIIKSLTKKNKLKDLTIINSCAVTNEAEKKVFYEIRKAKRQFPKNKIVLTGCAAQINPEKYKKLNEVDLIIGNNEKLEENTWKNLDNTREIIGNIFEVKKTHDHLIEKFEGKSRAYIEIQQGCDHRCTFCTIPYGRGNNRSVPVGVIINRIKLIVDNGYKEVVLTGVDITDYGKDLPGKPNLFQLCKRILNLVPKLENLRLSSLDCGEIDEDFWNILGDKRFMPYFHLSLQSGNDLILKRMKRRHSKEQIINFCSAVKKLRKDAVFGADIIAGFPTETDNMFNDTLEVIKKCGLIHLHVFPFSPRELTPASKMPQVPREIIKKRARILRNLGKEMLNEFLLNQIGKTTKVLIEKSNKLESLGKSEYFTNIRVSNEVKIGSIVNCKINNVFENCCDASLIA